MRTLIFFGLLLVAGAALAQSDYSDVPVEIRQAIVARCQTSMGEYGEDMVLYCAQEDIAAWRKIQQLPTTASSVVAACTQRMMDYGWDMVFFCVEEDMQAQKGLLDILN